MRADVFRQVCIRGFSVKNAYRNFSYVGSDKNFEPIICFCLTSPLSEPGEGGKQMLMIVEVGGGGQLSHWYHSVRISDPPVVYGLAILHIFDEI